jgi:hypothetical protein
MRMVGLMLGVVFASIASAGPATQPSRAELEKKFEKTMSNATLVGSYTMNGSNKPPADDKYTLGAVTKKDGDNWVITATIQYAGHDLPVPIELPVKWAGDTAVITVDNVGIPTLGTYTARVMIYGDEYVGIWGASDGSHGGKMWGKIEHNK